jgi:two-component system, sensor histidine kinase LadS
MSRKLAYAWLQLGSLIRIFTLSLLFVHSSPAKALVSNDSVTPVLGSDSSRVYASTQLPLQVLAGLPASSRPDQAWEKIQAQTLPYFDSTQIYALDIHQSLWLKLRVQVKEPALQPWVLRTEKTFLDRLELHHQDSNGQWQMQQAGDNIAHQDWSVRTLSPQFKLPMLPTGEHILLIKIVQGFPQQIAFELLPGALAEQKDFSELLVATGVATLLVLIFIFSVHLAWNYRDKIYAGYAVYALLSMLSVSAYLGFASYLFWPAAQTWPEYSILALILASLMAQLWFCQLMFIRASQSPWFSRTAKAAVLLAGVMMVVYFLLPTASSRIVAFAVGTSICIGMLIVIVGLAFRRGVDSATYWLVAYVPLIASVLLALAENLSLIEGTGLPYALPAYTLSFEAIVLLLALQMHAKDRHTLLERERMLGRIDPLTGLFSAVAFQDKLGQSWDKALANRSDMSVAFIALRERSTAIDKPAALRLEQSMLRTVRLLRIITRDIDIVGRLSGNTVAIGMPGMPMGDELYARLSRLVAMGQMIDRYDPDQQELHYRIAVSSLRAFSGDRAAMDMALRAEIISSAGWSRKPIHYLSSPEDLSQPAAALTAKAQLHTWDENLDRDGPTNLPVLNTGSSAPPPSSSANNSSTGSGS